MKTLEMFILKSLVYVMLVVPGVTPVTVMFCLEGLEESWNIPTFEQGRLVICNDVCGQNQ